jgi:hypothetical protein
MKMFCTLVPSVGASTVVMHYLWIRASMQMAMQWYSDIPRRAQEGYAAL